MTWLQHTGAPVSFIGNSGVEIAIQRFLQIEASVSDIFQQMSGINQLSGVSYCLWPGLFPGTLIHGSNISIIALLLRHFQ